MPIPESFLDELIARSDIVDVVSRYVNLKKSGANYFGLCPFHNEKTPSFSVSAERQIYHCFGCGVGGGVISFVMKMENLDFPEAVRHLAEMAGMVVPEDEEAGQGRRMRRERLYHLNREAALFYHDRLKEGGPGAEYFARRRLSARTVQRFGLGWAPEEWNTLLTAMTGAGYTKEELLDAGLIVKSDSGRLYDRFRGRAMFPIIDTRGHVLGFGGRVLDDSVPKYLNSPETMIFSKSRNLFALNLVKKSSSRRIILAEGYMDVIALHQSGFDTAVASLGTSLTEDQAKLMTRYADEVVIAYDQDQAGQAATARAIEILKRTGLRLKVLHFTGAKDPDEYIVKNGAEAFALLLERSENHVEYQLGQAALGRDLSDDEARVAFLKDAVASLASLDNQMEREIYLARAAKMAGVSENAVAHEVRRARAARRQKALREDRRRAAAPLRQAQPRPKNLRYENIRSALAEEKVLAMSYADPQLFKKAAESLTPEDFSSPFLGEVFRRMCRAAEEGRTFLIDLLTNGMTDEEAGHLTSILADEATGGGERALTDCVENIRMEKQKKAPDGETDLSQIASKYREKKGYGGSGTL